MTNPWARCIDRRAYICHECVDADQESNEGLLVSTPVQRILRVVGGVPVHQDVAVSRPLWDNEGGFRSLQL